MKPLLLERCAILNLLQQCPQTTCYEMRKKLSINGISLHESAVYRLVGRMVKEGLIEHDKNMIIITTKGKSVFARERIKLRLVFGKMAKF